MAQWPCSTTTIPTEPDHAQWLGSFGCRLRGYFHHAQSGLDFTVYRAYDAVNARWLNRDPIGEAGGINLYAYVSAGPLSGHGSMGTRSLSHQPEGAPPEQAKKRSHGADGKPNPGSGGNCADTVRKDIVDAGGPRLPPLGKGNTPKPENWGVELIKMGCYKLVDDPEHYKYKPGDIAIAVGTGTSHISIYDGNTWDADIAKEGPVPNRGGKYKDSKPTIYEYVGPR